MGQFSDDGQPEACRVLSPFRLGLAGVEPIENVFQVGGGNTGTVVANRHDAEAVIQLHLDENFGVGELDRVVDQVADGLGGAIESALTSIESDPPLTSSTPC